MPDLKTQLISDQRIIHSVNQSTNDQELPNPKKIKKDDHSNSSSSSIDGAAVSEASQALLDLNKRPFSPFGATVFYYSGFDWTHGVPNGHGMVFCDDQQTVFWRGKVINGKVDGHGEVPLINGSKYTGDLKEGELHGQGKSTFVNGDVYEGDWQHGKTHGKGKYTYADGDVYDGDWKNDHIHVK